MLLGKGEKREKPLGTVGENVKQDNHYQKQYEGAQN